MKNRPRIYSDSLPGHQTEASVHYGEARKLLRFIETFKLMDTFGNLIHEKSLFFLAQRLLQFTSDWLYTFIQSLTIGLSIPWRASCARVLK